MKGGLEMYNYLLKGLIKDLKKQDVTAFEIIFEEFRGLISFYAKKTGYEDTFGELSLFLIELLYSIDLSKFKKDKSDTLKRYIAVSIRNKYISLSKQFCEKEKREMSFFEKDSYSIGFEGMLDMLDALKHLSSSQRNVLIYKYVYSLSDCQIAEMLGITRQAVNRLKNRGLKSLKNYFSE